MEANAALRWDIPMLALCVEEGYKADYWLGVIISPAPGFDCSTEEKLAFYMDRIEKEIRAAGRARKGSRFVLLVCILTNMGLFDFQ